MPSFLARMKKAKDYLDHASLTTKEKKDLKLKHHVNAIITAVVTASRNSYTKWRY